MELDAPREPPRIKFVGSEVQVNSSTVPRTLKNLIMPFEILRHFDDLKKSNRRNLSPLKFFEFRTGSEVKKTIFDTTDDPENPELVQFKAKIASLKLLINRKKEKGQSVQHIPDMIAENLEGMSCKTFYSLWNYITNLLWLFADASRMAQLMYHRLRPSHGIKLVYDFKKLSDVFENIFYEGYAKMGKPNFSQLSGSSFLNFLRWRSIPHNGPFLNKFETGENVLIHVSSHLKCCEIFNSGKPLWGIAKFDAKDFKNSDSFESAPSWIFAAYGCEGFNDKDNVNPFFIN